MMKVIVQKIVIKFEHSEFGVVEDKDAEMNRQIEVNFLFSFFLLRNNHQEVQSG